MNANSFVELLQQHGAVQREVDEMHLELLKPSANTAQRAKTVAGLAKAKVELARTGALLTDLMPSVTLTSVQQTPATTLPPQVTRSMMTQPTTLAIQQQSAQRPRENTTQGRLRATWAPGTFRHEHQGLTPITPPAIPPQQAPTQVRGGGMAPRLDVQRAPGNGMYQPHGYASNLANAPLAMARIERTRAAKKALAAAAAKASGT